MGKARDLARLSPDNSGKILLSSGVAGVLPDANAPSGSVIQVVQNVYKGYSDYSLSNSWATVTPLNTVITPSSTSSKIHIRAVIYVGNAGTGNPPYHALDLTRNGTGGIFVGNALSARVRSSAAYRGTGQASEIGCMVIDYIDSPATTSAITYGFNIYGYGSRVMFINITDDYDAASGRAVVSTVTLTEVVG